MKNHERFVLRYDLNMSAGGDTAEIMVYSSIVSRKWREQDPEVTALDFDKIIKDAKAQGAKKLHIRINSPGGNVFQAVAMRAMLMNSGFDEITASIEGLCASAATLLTSLPGTKVTIAEGSSFMIHNPMTYAFGTSADLSHEAERMAKMEKDCHKIYAERSGKTEDEIKEMMDKETWMTASEAVKNGFCDNVLKAAQAVACVSEEQMNAMQAIYHNMPEMAVQQPKTAEVSNAGGDSANPAASENKSNQEESNMEIKDITMDQLRAENPELLNQAIMAERQRVQDIDDLTMPGYEEMAAEAKKNGTTAMEFQKMVVKAQREKGKSFMQGRTEETKPAAQVEGGASDDHDGGDDAEMKAHLKEMEMYLKQARANSDGMY